MGHYLETASNWIEVQDGIVCVSVAAWINSYMPRYAYEMPIKMIEMDHVALLLSRWWTIYLGKLWNAKC